MRRKMIATVLAVLLYIPVGLVGADCLAGVLFDVTNKRIPESLSLDRWPEAWLAYREDATRCQTFGAENNPSFSSQKPPS